jgi:Family of unknown function (DUF6455)
MLCPPPSDECCHERSRHSGRHLRARRRPAPARERYWRVIKGSARRASANQVCQNWLVRAPERVDKAPAFCPNAKLFASVRDLINRGIDNGA